MKKLHPVITNREFKLLIKPKGLDRHSKIAALSEQIFKFCRTNKVIFFHLDNANTGLRNIYFYDTPGEHFRLNNVILRVRESRQNVWVDDFAELTLKCRTHDMSQATIFNPKPYKKIKARMRFKEEILRGDEIGSQRQIYSNNAILNSVPIDDLFERTFSSVCKFFPGLTKLDIDKKLPLRIVGGSANKILEACLPLGNLVFGNGVEAHCDIAIWFRTAGDPIVGELAFSYRVNDENRTSTIAHKNADKFFNKLEIGSTKTALIYGKPE
jgi:hypothetical protein